MEQKIKKHMLHSRASFGDIDKYHGIPSLKKNLPGGLL